MHTDAHLRPTVMMHKVALYMLRSFCLYLLFILRRYCNAICIPIVGITLNSRASAIVFTACSALFFRFLIRSLRCSKKKSELRCYEKIAELLCYRPFFVQNKIFEAFLLSCGNISVGRGIDAHHLRCEHRSFSSSRSKFPP